MLEEAAYCDPGLISEVIVPLLSMQSSCLLCISTLLESGNHYSKMFELTDSIGNKLFETISISLVCGTQSLLSHALFVALPLPAKLLSFLFPLVGRELHD